MPTKLTVANETIQELTAKLEDANAALTTADERIETLVADRESAEKKAETLEERVNDLTSQRDALEMRGNAADATAEGLRVSLDEAEGRAQQLRGQLEDAQMTINRLSGELETALTALKVSEEEVDIQLHRIEGFKNRSQREHKRASAANVKNEELRKALRKTEFERRRLQLLIDGDAFHIRQVQVLTEQLNLVRSVVNAHLTNDDRVADVPVEELLK